MPDYLVAIKRETTTGTAATDGGAQQMRTTDSPGLELKRAQIQSQERRADALMTLGRLGGKTVDGSYNAEVTLGGVTDMLLEAIVRGSWTATVTILPAAMTSITTTTNTIIAAGGSWITQGVRVGDIVTLADHSSAANNGLRLRVTNVTATTITVAGTPLVANPVADATFSLIILKKLINPAVPTSYSHTVEQYDRVIDQSELFLGCRLVGLNVSCRPGAMATLQYTFMGLDRTILVSGTSPWFTSPTVTTGLALIADDSAIQQDGVVITTLTGFDLNFQITANGEPVIGSFVSPDVYDEDLAISGTITGLRNDFSNLQRYDAETTFSVGIMLAEPGAAPQGVLGIYLPVVKIAALSGPGVSSGRVETRTLMVGPQAASTGRDATAVIIHSSAA